MRDAASGQWVTKTTDEIMKTPPLELFPHGCGVGMRPTFHSLGTERFGTEQIHCAEPPLSRDVVSHLTLGMSVHHPDLSGLPMVRRGN